MSEQLNVAFIGNPNCGKTTLFNAYTGAKLKVANWPGVTCLLYTSFSVRKNFLKAVCRPAGDPGDGEDWCEQFCRQV